MKEIEQTLDSREVAGMVDKEHKYLMRDIKRYTQILTGEKISPVDFFKKSTYEDAKGETRPCYRITKKGCEFIGHKIRGEKGVVFTARYINRFHEMQDILSNGQQESELPWFIRRFRGNYIMLFRDFETVTGVEIFGNYTAWKRPDKLQGGLDYNGWGWYTVINKEEFLKEYGFEYGDEEKRMMYLYPRGIKRALEIYRRESGRKLNQEAYDMIMNGLKAIEPPKKEIAAKKPEPIATSQPVQISIIVGNEQKAVVSI